jgi:DNA-binding GntR family transcriptional regulator
MIAARRFSSGIWINVEELTKELGVSRTPIRQAMKQLEAEGLVTHLPNRGIRMAEMTLEMARDLYEVREVLEGLAAGLAAENISAASLTGLRKILAEQSVLIKKKDLLPYSLSDFNFHQIIYEACGNRLLKEQLEQIKGRSRPLVCDITSILGELYRDHQNLVQAFKVRDALEAKEVMTQHNQRMRRLIEKTQNDLKAS